MKCIFPQIFPHQTPIFFLQIFVKRKILRFLHSVSAIPRAISFSCIYANTPIVQSMATSAAGMIVRMASMFTARMPFSVFMLVMRTFYVWII